MNTASDSPLQELPDLSDETIARIEREVFADIGGQRRPAAPRAERRRRAGWMTAGAAAAIIVVAAVIAPSVQGWVSGASGGSVSLADAPVSPVPALEAATDGGASLDEGTSMSDVGGAAATRSQRDIIATAAATVEVTDAATAAEAVGAAAVGRGGYVESMTLEGAGAVTRSTEPLNGDMVLTDPAMPYGYGGNAVTVRVPSAQLSAAIAELAEIGDVTASTINRQDVTEQTVDLRARIDAARTSVDRLSELMAQATSVADLLSAEQALSERQATLESYQQQLTWLESQISLSSLTVTLVEPADTVAADPAGFGDGLAAGWNGLVATLNGIVIALGFLLPWLIVLGLVVVIAWGIRRAITRRRRNRPAADADADAEE